MIWYVMHMVIIWCKVAQFVGHNKNASINEGVRIVDLPLSTTYLIHIRFRFHSNTSFWTTANILLSLCGLVRCSLNCGNAVHFWVCWGCQFNAESFSLLLCICQVLWHVDCWHICFSVFCTGEIRQSMALHVFTTSIITWFVSKRKRAATWFVKCDSDMCAFVERAKGRHSRKWSKGKAHHMFLSTCRLSNSFGGGGSGSSSSSSSSV